MQTSSLKNVLDHLRVTFAFDIDETRKLLTMLHKTLIESVPILSGNEAEPIYQKSHNLHSELHMCGNEELSELAATIELKAKAGEIDHDRINTFITESQLFARDLSQWLSSE